MRWPWPKHEEAPAPEPERDTRIEAEGWVSFVDAVPTSKDMPIRVLRPFFNPYVTTFGEMAFNGLHELYWKPTAIYCEWLERVDLHA